MASTQFARGQFSKAQQRFAIKIGKALTRGNHLQKLRFIGRKIPARIRQRLHHFPLKRQHRRYIGRGQKPGNKAVYGIGFQILGQLQNRRLLQKPKMLSYYNLWKPVLSNTKNSPLPRLFKLIRLLNFSPGNFTKSVDSFASSCYYSTTLTH